MPDSPASAFSAVEQLLLGDAPDNAGHEERNYRLPLQLRTNLDALASALGSRPRPQRSLLIHALVAAHAPANGDQARELITTQRIDALRAAMRESAAD
ncbi:MAG: hypothetical protein KY463_12520 [Actinobacteria bacterium]|nr:hypothetical protein [Actinomycetota bacterium]